jgi:starch synthase (maltosyl-transferring)
MAIDNGRARVVISGVTPEIDAGRFPIKRTVGEKLVVEADIFADGHDALAGVLLYHAEHESQWHEVAMSPLVNDRWRGEFRVTALGFYLYTVQAWVDRFMSWREGFRKKVAANQVASIDVLIGAELLDAAAQRARGAGAAQLSEWSEALRHNPNSMATIDLALADEVAALMAAYPERQCAVTYERELRVVVDPEKARYSAWYEMFPRSCAPEAGRYGTFADCEQRLPYVAAMGFDVLYLPPIHPIGRTFRKGKNNALTTTEEDPGSPWAIGSSEGGHKAIHPQLGTLEDFRRLVRKAGELGIDIALDLAYQCTPDHPYVKEHPQWFRHRPDGSIQYAENPPKKYQDIYPIDFETEDWRALWEELKSIVQFWIDQGVRIFRVDNPHTKSFRFWEWMIGEIRKTSPEVIFLSEAFTRPKVQYHLAQLGFNQSYTYFAWRNTKAELTQYLTDLTQTEVREYFRPNLWPNTPDILTEYLQFGGRPAFIARLVLAATLGASYGIYGPAFELCENRPREAGSEEYLDSEKYEIRHWDLRRPESLKDIITRMNQIRRDNPALHSNERLLFHPIDNDQLICYSKHNEDGTNLILVVVNLDPHHTHAGWLELPLDALGLTTSQSYQVHDLLSDARYLWRGPRNYVQVDPHAMPAHIFRLRRRVRSERDFDYYM